MDICNYKNLSTKDIIAILKEIISEEKEFIDKFIFEE